MTNFPDTNNNSTAPDPNVGWVAGNQFTTDEGVVYTWTGYSWTTEGSGSDGGDYLPLTGGDLTGPLTSTSSITAAGLVTAGNRLVANADGVKSGIDNTFISYNESALVTASIAADGSITAAGKITATTFDLEALPALP